MQDQARPELQQLVKLLLERDRLSALYETAGTGYDGNVADLTMFEREGHTRGLYRNWQDCARFSRRISAHNRRVPLRPRELISAAEAKNTRKLGLTRSNTAQHAPKSRKAGL